MANIDKNFRVKNGLDVKGTINLAAIAESKSETAVDVFVYDTSKDTDGGAWRHRTQHTSWYNETLNTSTRGSRKEFPAVAVIVVEGVSPNRIVIYDGDDPALPMWMKFDYTIYNGFLHWASSAGYGSHSVAMLNGILVNGGGSGSWMADFNRDHCTLIYTANDYALPNPQIANRNSSGSFVRTGFSHAVINATINEVAMTVLPDAPTDPATGLPTPTIAVATTGGVSVIKDDGTVVNPPPYVAKNSRSIDIGKNGDLFNDGVLATTWSDSYAPYDDGNWSSAQGFSYVGNYPTTRFGSSTNQSNIIVTPYGFAGEGMMPANSFPMLYQMMLDPSDVRDGSAVAYTTSTYNTGWMNGDIKGAFLSDTDDTNLVGSGELVTNGGFDTDLTGWTTVSGGWVWDNGTAKDTAGSAGLLIQSNVFELGTLYLVSFDVVSISGGNMFVRYRNNDFGSNTNLIKLVSSPGSYAVPWYHPSDILKGLAFVSGSGVNVVIDNISVKLADADRSVNNNALIVNGTVTRTAVATGADLVAYSGFSTSNYLEQPYNSDLDFGTGDFCYMGWFKTTDTQGILFCRADSSLSGTQFRIFINSRQIQTTCGSATVVATDGLDYNAGNWNFVTVVRRSGVEHVYANGEQIAVRNRAGSVTNTSATLRQGVAQNDSSPLVTGSLALWRISATAPTAAQIKKIYEDEKFLFQENAQATLYGTSDAVTALGHDEDTGLLHVGTSAGRSVFQGLRRVDNTTDAVGTAISAVGGLVVEE